MLPFCQTADPPPWKHIQLSDTTTFQQRGTQLVRKSGQPSWTESMWSTRNNTHRRENGSKAGALHIRRTTYFSQQQIQSSDTPTGRSSKTPSPRRRCTLWRRSLPRSDARTPSMRRGRSDSRKNGHPFCSRVPRYPYATHCKRQSVRACACVLVPRSCKAMLPSLAASRNGSACAQ